DVLQYNTFPVTVGQFPYGVSQDSPSFLSLGFSVRRFGRVFDFNRPAGRSSCVQRCFSFSTPNLSSNSVLVQIDDDSIQPRVRRRIAAKPSPGSKRPQERLLRQVSRLFGIAGQLERHIVNASLIVRNHPLELIARRTHDPIEPGSIGLDRVDAPSFRVSVIKIASSSSRSPSKG